MSSATGFTYLSLRQTANGLGNFAITVTNAGSVAQNTTCTIPDPGVTATTFALINSTITAGHLVAAGTAAGTLVDGGVPGAGAVLLSPSGDQIITAHALAIASGELFSGASGTAAGVLALYNNSGTGLFEIFNSLSNPSSNFDVTITTGSTLAQSTFYLLPDPGVSTCTFSVTPTAITSGNIVVAGAAAGLLSDSGVSVSQLELVSNVKAQISSNIGGAGAGPISVTVTGMTSASPILATVSSSSNPVSVISTVSGVDSFMITFSGDPGANCIINYIAFIAPQ